MGDFPKTMWEVWCGNIDQITVVSETDKTVNVRRSATATRKAMKRTEGGGVFDTWEDARAFIVKSAEASLKRAEDDVDYCKARLDRLRSLQKPLTAQ